MQDDFESQVAGVAALNDPVRRSLYVHVASSTDAVGREEAAAAVGVQRALAAFHLDKLVDEGLLEFEYRRLTGRTGPGAGRPAKVYRRSRRQIEISLPAREYDLAGRLLARAITAAERSGRAVRAELESEAFAFGEAVGAEILARAGARSSKARQRRALLEVLARHGFEPRQPGDDIVLANCPFHALAQQFSELVCGMNLHLMRGVHSRLGAGADHLEPQLAPAPGRCCVTFGRTAG
ncbi:MAG TPA: transcriptional regulator [Acidimicrobiales bacterium]|nr:transcriptional regulator [Acidimicrobiales bacterium]